jgi:hypothetical protein
MPILAAPVFGIIFSVMACCTSGNCFAKATLGQYVYAMPVDVR